MWLVSKIKCGTPRFSKNTQFEVEQEAELAVEADCEVAEIEEPLEVEEDIEEELADINLEEAIQCIESTISAVTAGASTEQLGALVSSVQSNVVSMVSQAANTGSVNNAAAATATVTATVSVSASATVSAGAGTGDIACKIDQLFNEVVENLTSGSQGGSVSSSSLSAIQALLEKIMGLLQSLLNLLVESGEGESGQAAQAQSGSGESSAATSQGSDAEGVSAEGSHQDSQSGVNAQLNQMIGLLQAIAGNASQNVNGSQSADGIQADGNTESASSQSAVRGNDFMECAKNNQGNSAFDISAEDLEAAISQLKEAIMTSTALSGQSANDAGHGVELASAASGDC